MKSVWILNSKAKLEISPEGGQVLGWDKLNTKTNLFEPVLYKGSTLKRTGIPILFPFANPLKNNIFDFTHRQIPSHGFGRNSTWRVTHQDANKCILTLSNEDIDLDMQEAYPFKFEANIELSLSSDGNLRYKLLVINKDMREMPICPGLHPYFTIPHEQKQLLKTNLAGFVPSTFDWNGELNGDFFDFEGKAEFNFPKHKLIIMQHNDKNPQELFRYLVVWSQNKQQSDFDFVCLEPFSRDTNALNDNPILIKAGQTWIADFEMVVEFNM